MDSTLTQVDLCFQVLWALCRSSYSHRKQGIRYFLPVLARCTLEIQNGYKWIVQFWLNIDIFQVILSLFGLFRFVFFYFILNGLDDELTLFYTKIEIDLTHKLSAIEFFYW